MSEITVYQLAHSPFCFPVTGALSALGVPHSIRNVSNADRSEIIKLTGGKHYQVPVLVADERCVFDGSEGGADGQDLPRFIDITWGKGRLFPRSVEGLQQIVIQHLENDVELVTFKLADIKYIPSVADLAERCMIIRHKERRFGKGCLKAWETGRADLWAQAVGALEPYEKMLDVNGFLFGDKPVYSDFLLHGLLANLTYNGWNPLPPLPRIEDWFARIRNFRY